MLGAGGADELVVGDAEAIPEGAEFAADFVGELLRRFAGGGGGALDLLAMLVGSGEEERVMSQHALAAGYGVTDNGCVGVADVRPRIDIVDRSGDVKLFALLAHRNL